MGRCVSPTGAATHAEVPALCACYCGILVRLTNIMQMPPMPLSVCWGAPLSRSTLAGCGLPLKTELGLWTGA